MNSPEHGQYARAIKAFTHGSDLTLAMNPVFLDQYLRALPRQDTLFVSVFAPNRPLLFRSKAMPQAMAVIMPVHLDPPARKTAPAPVAQEVAA